jgi:hypothetical protein
VALSLFCGQPIHKPSYAVNIDARLVEADEEIDDNFELIIILDQKGIIVGESPGKGRNTKFGKKNPTRVTQHKRYKKRYTSVRIRFIAVTGTDCPTTHHPSTHHTPSIAALTSPQVPESSCRRRCRSRGSAAARTGRPGSRRTAAQKRRFTRCVGPNMPAQTLWRRCAPGVLWFSKERCTIARLCLIRWARGDR